MATTTKLMYEGATKKADLVRILRERGYQNDIARPITKWKNAELVQALIDTENEGAPTAEPGDEESEDDDSDDDSSNDDSDDDSDDDSSNENDDSKADNTTALGFMMLLGVDIDTPENNLGDLASSTFAEGPKGVEILAAAASSSLLPATFFVAGPWLLART